MFKEARQADTAAPKGALDPYRFGVEANRAALERVIDYSVKQQMIPKKIAVDDLFDDVTRKLGLSDANGGDAMRAPIRSIAAGLLLLATSLPSAAQDAASFPNRPVRIVVPFPAGGPTDINMRIIGAEAVRALGPGRGDREPARRQHRHRRADGREVGARRLHAAGRDGHHDGDESGDRHAA